MFNKQEFIDKYGAAQKIIPADLLLPPMEPEPDVGMLEKAQSEARKWWEIGRAHV